MFIPTFRSAGAPEVPSTETELDDVSYSTPPTQTLPKAVITPETTPLGTRVVPPEEVEFDVAEEHPTSTRTKPAAAAVKRNSFIGPPEI
jgi:hypothetical protein